MHCAVQSMRSGIAGPPGPLHQLLLFEIPCYNRHEQQAGSQNAPPEELLQRSLHAVTSVSPWTAVNVGSGCVRAAFPSAQRTFMSTPQQNMPQQDGSMENPDPEVGEPQHVDNKPLDQDRPTTTSVRPSNRMMLKMSSHRFSGNGFSERPSMGKPKSFSFQSKRK